MDVISILTVFKKASFLFFKAIKQIIKLAAHQERYGLADVVLLMNGAPATMPRVRSAYSVSRAMLTKRQQRLSMFRWQVHDTSKLPADVMKAATRKRDKRKLVGF